MSSSLPSHDSSAPVPPPPTGAAVRGLLRLGLLFDRETEARYQADRFDDHSFIARIALVLTGVAMALFVLVDQYFMGGRYPAAVQALLLYACAPLTSTGGLLLMYPVFARNMRWVVTAVLLANTAVWSWCYPRMVHDPGAPPYAFEALLLFAAMVYAFSGFMFWTAVGVAALSSLVFIVVMSLFSTIHSATLVYCSFYLLGTNVIAMLQAYLREQASRASFIAKQQLIELAEHDPLTGLFNRRAFNQRLEDLVRQARREQVGIAVLAMDVDYFKDVNDGLGHHFGDQVLVAAAEAIRNALKRPLDCVARMGGDEFVAVWYDMALGNLRPSCDQLMASFDEKFKQLTDRHPAQLSMSVGVVYTVPAAWQDGESLLKFADGALYQTKAQGRAAYTVLDLSEVHPLGTLQLVTVPP
jgi:diguanylate cyclase (GGDEF)-like protein